MNTLPYPGAPAEDVEFLVTRPIEEQLREVSGIEELASTSSFGNSSFRITIDSKNFDSREVVQEVKGALGRQSFLQARRAELDTLRAKIIKQRQQTEVSKNRWLTAQKIFSQEQLRYRRGQISLESLIDTENLLANSQFSYHSNLAQLSKDVVEWLRQTDQLVTKEEELEL